MLVALAFLHNAGPGAGAESWMSLWGQVQTRRYLFFGNSGGVREGTDVSEAERGTGKAQGGDSLPINTEVF